MIARSFGVFGRFAAVLCLGSFALVSACKATKDLGGSSGTPALKAPANATFSVSGTCGYTLDFGQVAVGSTTTLDLTLGDTGSSPLTIVNVSAPTDAEFSMVLPQQAIQPGGTSSVSVSFKPFGEGAKSGTVSFTTDSTACPTVTVGMSGTGVYLKLLADPTTVDFGQVVVHSSPVKVVTLTNNSALSIGVTPSAIGGPQASLFTVDKTAAFDVAAGQSVQMHVTYSPLVPSAQDIANLTLTLSEGGSIPITMQGVALQSGLQIKPIPLDFKFVQPGSSVTKSLTLTNVGNENITVSSTSIVNPGTPAAFFIAGTSWTGGVLKPGDTKNVDVTFSPSTKDQYAGELDVSSTDSNNIVPVALTGFGGGAIISCTPTALAFGTVAANIGATLPVICTNTGTDVPNHPEAGLSIVSMLSTNPLFSGAVSPVSPPQPLAAGQSLQVDVAYSPVDTSTDTGILTINSNATLGTALTPPSISLSGDAISELPCTYTLTPAEVNFGQVKPNETITGGFSINNIGTNECLVTGLNLGAGTSSAFVLTSGAVNSQRLSAPGSGGLYPSSLQVNVQFKPQQTGSYSGTVQFTISNRAAPHQTVNLSGLGGNSCFIIQPAELNFGTVGISNGQFCANGKRKFVGVNGCAQTVNIQSVTLEAGSVYSFIAESTPQAVPQGGTSTPFEVGFKPVAAGTFNGSVLVQTDLQSSPFGVGLTGQAVNGNHQTDEYQGHTPAVDVLLVMDSDDDPDMRSKFSEHVGDFVTAAQTLNLDFQIGVTSTSDCPGSEPNGEQGQIIPCPNCKGGSGVVPTIITSADQNAATDVANLVLFPNYNWSDGCPVISDDEHFFDVAYKALITNGLGYNAPLIRSFAYLAVIETNGDDEDEQDAQTPQWYANQFLTVKGSDHPELFSWSYINPSQYGSPGGHTPFNRLPERIKSMLNLVGGVALDYTQTDWWKGVIDLWNIVLASTTRFPLSGTPDPTTIQVYLDGPPPSQTPPGQASGVQIFATNPNGSTNWSYDATANTLDISASNLTLSSSDKLYITYVIVCN